MNIQATEMNAYLEIRNQSGMAFTFTAQDNETARIGEDTEENTSIRLGTVQIRKQSGTVTCSSLSVNRNHQISLTLSGASAPVQCAFRTHRTRQGFEIPHGIAHITVHFRRREGFAVSYEDVPAAAEQSVCSGEQDPFLELISARNGTTSDVPAAFPVQMPEACNAKQTELAKERALYEAQERQAQMLTDELEKIREMRENAASKAYLERLLSEIGIDLDTLSRYREDPCCQTADMQELADRCAVCCAAAKNYIMQMMEITQHTADRESVPERRECDEGYGRGEREDPAFGVAAC